MGEEKALAEACVMPVCVLPANGDPMDDVKAVMDTKPLGPKCIYQRFDDQTHGFRECSNTPENSNTPGNPFLVHAHRFEHLLFGGINTFCFCLLALESSSNHQSH